MFETAEEKKERLARISRENGSKGRGPVTEEGKARSRMNSLRHGLYAAERVLLAGESEEEYEACRFALYEQLDPETPAEERLVEVIASAMWRMDRVPGLETDLFRKSESPVEALTSPGMHSLVRQYAALDRAIDRAMRRLKELQRLRSRGRSLTPVSDALRRRVAPASSVAPLSPAASLQCPSGILPEGRSQNEGTNPAPSVAPASSRWNVRLGESQTSETNPATSPASRQWHAPTEDNETNPEPAPLKLARGEVEVTERTQQEPDTHLTRKERRALARAKGR